MALKKSVTIGGVTGEYWRIERFDIQTFTKGGGVVSVGLYANAAAAKPGAHPQTVRHYRFPDTVLSKTHLVEKTGHAPQDPYKKLYTWLKTQSDFTGAVDA